MAAPAFTATEVGQVIQFVAPGFFCYSAYTWRVPSKRAGAMALLILSIGLSLPLVAVMTWIAERVGVEPDPLSVRYVLPLLALSLAAGYMAGEVRSRDWTRRMLLRAGFPYEPDAVLAASLQRLPAPTLVTILFKDGRVLEGQPVRGTNDPALPTQQLYVSYARWWDHTANEWEGEREFQIGHEPAPIGVLVNLEEVLTISVLEKSEPASVSRDGEQTPPEPTMAAGQSTLRL